ncbi:MAG: sulfatase, partial [Verrucomicrobiales bacterium]|nr:sulfatase [Verrucomicrobiales bacterium]
MKFLSALLAIVLISPALSATDRPNFVLIFIDDMGYGDIEPFGSTVNATPNLNRMAAEGMKLTSFYAAPVCSASRAQLLTSSYAPRVSIPGVLFPRQGTGLNPDEHTVADYLKEVGYATACVGKWHLGDQVSFLPTRQGFDSYFGIPYSNDMQKTATESGLRVTPLIRDEKVADLLEDEEQRRVTREYTEEAVKFIQSKADGDEPFFLYMPHTAMHVPLFPHQDFVGKSTNGVYGDWIAEVDWSVGEILKTLDQADLSENTLVIFTSDNGPWASKGKAGGLSGPLRGSKGCTLEGGVRVPTIARWIGQIEGGTTSDAITGTTDILPTFTALAGAKLKSGRQIDGVDITDVLLGEANQSSREAWYYFGGTKLQAVRQGPWKLAVTPQKIGMGFDNLGNDDIKRGGRLYNLGQEIGEMTDLAGAHPEVVAKLQALADAMAKEITTNRRPAGQVENPVMLYPSDAPLRSERKKLPRKPPNWTKVKAGDVIDTNSAPGIAGNAFTVEVVISGENLSGPIVAHGGSAVG